MYYFKNLYTIHVSFKRTIDILGWFFYLAKNKSIIKTLTVYQTNYQKPNAFDRKPYNLILFVCKSLVNQFFSPRLNYLISAAYCTNICQNS